MKYKCIIFDCDGVLVDSVTLSTQVLVDMAKEVGFVIPMEHAIDKFSGGSLKDCFDYIEQGIEGTLPDSFEKEFRDRTFKIFRKDLKPIAGIHALLKRITVPYCVASSGPMEKMQVSLTTANLIDKFEGRIFSSYDIQRWKPDPAIFLHAADQMGFKPADCIVIEDSVDGIRAAKSGGFDVLGFVNGNNGHLLKDEDVRCFHDMNVLDILL